MSPTRELCALLCAVVVCTGCATPEAAISVAPSSAESPARSPAITPRFAQDFEQPQIAEGTPAGSDYRVEIYAERPTGALPLFLFSSPAKSPRGAVLLFHSGGWTRGRPEWLFGLAKQLSTLGLLAVPVRYRLSGDGVSPIDAIADACAAFRWVREHASELQVDPHRIAGWGASAGSLLIASGATAGCPDSGASSISGAADALLLVSGGTDTERSPQFRKLVGEGVPVSRYSPLANVRPGLPPTLIVNGEADAVTKLESANQYCEAARSQGALCEVAAFPGLGHLLTRKIDDQRTALDPDPTAEREAYDIEVRFLRKLGFIEPRH